MKNVHVLSTEKLIKSAGDLVKDKYGSIHIFTKNDGKEYGKTTTKLNIYITSSNEEIKDWFIYKTENKAVILKAKNINSDTITVDSHIEVGTWVSLKYCKKIILTTDDRLIKDGVQPIDDEFLEWFVKNPSCEFVEVKECYLGSKCLKCGFIENHDEVDTEDCPKCHNRDYEHLYNNKIIIPQEELDYTALLQPVGIRQETLEEAAEKYVLNEPNTTLKLISKYSFKDGAKWQAERMYSEEEVIAIVEKSRETGLTAEYLLLTDQYKKK
jgi:hypothetical protein